MIRHFFTLDGKSSEDFNTWIAQSNMWDGAVHDDSMVEVPGRNGALIFSNGRYKNFSARLLCYIPHGMHVNVDGLRSFLSSKYGYVKYEDNLHPDEYRMVRYAGGFALSEADRIGASFDLDFDCKPQRFLNSGDIVQAFTASGSIYNPTEYAAKPLVKCYGTSGTVTIAGVAVTVTGCTNHVILDCDLMEAYEGSTSRNGTTTLVNGDFPTLKSGNNAVSFTGFSKVEITPRWWCI